MRRTTTGDEVSVEAIADSNPAWILVMDRSAAVDSDNPDFQPAAEIIQGQEALQNVDAIKSGQVVYMPNDAYINREFRPTPNSSTPSRTP